MIRRHGPEDRTPARATGRGFAFGPAGAEAPEPTLEQMAEDVAAFLMWAAEPHMTDRKQSGFKYMMMLLALTVLLYFTNKALWAKVKRKE